MKTRIIATLAIVGTIVTSSFGTAHAGILFEAVKAVGKGIVHKAVADEQERQQRAYYEQQRAQQRRIQQQRIQQQQRAQQRAPDQPAAQTGQVGQALPTGTVSGTAAATGPTGSEL